MSLPTAPLPFCLCWGPRGFTPAWEGWPGVVVPSLSPKACARTGAGAGATGPQGRERTPRALLLTGKTGRTMNKPMHFGHLHPQVPLPKSVEG